MNGWPWLIAALWLIAYEGYALITHQPTLTQMAQRAAREKPWLPIAVVGFVILLIIHLWGCTTFGGWCF